MEALYLSAKKFIMRWAKKIIKLRTRFKDRYALREEEKCALKEVMPGNGAGG